MEGVPDELLALIGNLARHHRQHEQFYAQAPLEGAANVQRHSRILKALADHWSRTAAAAQPAASPFAGAEDLNPPGLTAETGVLFMEAGDEPAEIAGLRRELDATAQRLAETGEWLASAMAQSWQVVGSLAAYPELTDVIGERHRIVANDWQSSSLQTLSARLLRRSVELLERIDFGAAAIREDISGPRNYPPYLYATSELLDRAADLLAESAVLVHDNERRWRTFSARVAELEPPQGPDTQRG